jgi:hypothetical protein
MVGFALWVYKTLVVRFCDCVCRLTVYGCVKTGKFWNRRFEFAKRSQLFIRTHNENAFARRVGCFLLIVQKRLGCRFGQFKGCAHFLDLRRLLFQLCRLLVKHIRGERQSPLQFQARFFDCLLRSDSILFQ